MPEREGEAEELPDILRRELAGESISPDEEGYEAIAEVIEHAKRVCAKLNTGYHTREEIHDLFEELVGHPVDPTFRLNAPFRTDFGHNIKVGRDSYVNWDCLFMDRGGITLGDGVLIAPKVNLITLNHVSDPHNLTATVCRPIVIGDRVWIGTGATVLPGVTVGDNAVIGAAAVVTKDVAANTIVAGNPARVIGRK